MRIPTTIPNSAGTLQNFYTSNISKRIKRLIFKAHIYGTRSISLRAHSCLSKLWRKRMAVVSVIYEANQLCHAFDNDPLLFKITIHSLVMCHKAKYQTWSKTLMCDKFVSDLQDKWSPILSPTHLFRIYKDFNYKKTLQWPRREIGPFNSWLGPLQSGRNVKFDSLFSNSIQYIIHCYTMHMWLQPVTLQV